MIIKVPIQLKHGSAAEWATSDPVLLAGELGYDSTNNSIKVGDGLSVWSALPFLSSIAATLTGASDPNGTPGTTGAIYTQIVAGTATIWVCTGGTTWV